eukprot:PITA_31688
MAISGKIEIKKFNGQSFELWKLKVEDLLVDKDQWTIVDPREAIEKALLDKLGTLYQSMSLLNKLFLQKKLYNLRMKDGDSMTEHLNEFNTVDSKLVKVPIPIGVKLFVEQCPKTQEEEEDMSRVPFAGAVSSLMYAMVYTRPYIAHAVGVLSRFMSKLGKEHWTTMKGVFRYLCDTSDYGLCYQGRQGLGIVLDIPGFVDADWARDLDQRRPKSGYLFNLFRGAGAIGIDCDSQSAIFLAKNPTYHSKTKHIDVQYHFVRDMIEDKKVLLVKVDTLKNIVDALKKSVSSKKVSSCRETMGVAEMDK